MIRPVQQGFSLIELSLVLFVSAMLLRAAIVPLPHLRDTALRKQTQQQLQDVKQALIGYVIKTGALPCPITDKSKRAPSCSALEGGVPAALLGLLGAVDSNGAVLDPWGNPLRYALSQADHPSEGTVGLFDWSAPGEVAAIGLTNVQADLTLCLSGKVSCTKQHLRANKLVAIILSDASDNSLSAAQLENQDGDTQYVLQGHSQVPGEVFDDLLVTLSSGDMAYWLLRGGWL